LFIILLQANILSAGCGSQPADISENGKAEAKTPDSRQEESSAEVDWGREIDLDEMITMAREARIREIQWHVLPNILRAETSDGEIFHLRNENKGVDLRNTLINAGVKVGKGGILFQHVF